MSKSAQLAGLVGRLLTLYCTVLLPERCMPRATAQHSAGYYGSPAISGLSQQWQIAISWLPLTGVTHALYMRTAG